MKIDKNILITVRVSNHLSIPFFFQKNTNIFFPKKISFFYYLPLPFFIDNMDVSEVYTSLRDL